MLPMFESLMNHASSVYLEVLLWMQKIYNFGSQNLEASEEILHEFQKRIIIIIYHNAVLSKSCFCSTCVLNENNICMNSKYWTRIIFLFCSQSHTQHKISLLLYNYVNTILTYKIITKPMIINCVALLVQHNSLIHILSMFFLANVASVFDCVLSLQGNRE